MGVGEMKRRDDSPPREFPEILHRFKRRGCNLLVTGSVPDGVTDRATRTLFGKGRYDRKRVLALTDATPKHTNPRLPSNANVEDATTWVIDQQNVARNVPDAAVTAPDVPLPTVEPDQTDIRRFRQEIVSAIGFFAQRNDGLEPSELRLSMYSLRHLIETNDQCVVERFLHSVTALICGVNGMAHYHLSVADDSPLVDDLSGLFDARIELRKRDDTDAEQRWHLPKHDVTTNWVTLS